jgi:peptide-methionine (S)-S-oxide reductase
MLLTMKPTAIAAALTAAFALSGAAPLSATAQGAGLKTAVFAGGCFWSAEYGMERLRGVKDVVVGYAGGGRANPTYQNHSGHLEAIRVTYDPAQVSYAQLVDAFFRNIDPTDAGGQICDRGPSYRTAVFTSDPAERQTAEQVRAGVVKAIGRPVATEIRPAARFWVGEAYHQDFARKNPVRYNAYKIGCGREARIKAVWSRKG